MEEQLELFKKVIEEWSVEQKDDDPQLNLFQKQTALLSFFLENHARIKMVPVQYAQKVEKRSIERFINFVWLSQPNELHIPITGLWGKLHKAVENKKRVQKALSEFGV